MPYSVDADANRDNPRSPSELIGLGDQVLYRLAALDATVTSGFRRIDENVERLRNDLHESQIATNDKINNLDKEMNERFAQKRARTDALAERVTAMETWQKVIMARVGIVIGIVITAWTFLAPSIRALLGIANG